MGRDRQAQGKHALLRAFPQHRPFAHVLTTAPARAAGAHAQMVVANHESGDALREVIKMLRQSAQQAQAENIVHVMRAWGQKNGIKGL